MQLQVPFLMQLQLFFADNHIPYKENLIGFGADAANSMLRAHNSLSTLLKKDIPTLFFFLRLNPYAGAGITASLVLFRGRPVGGAGEGL